MDSSELKYVGFLPRVGAAVIDTIILVIITWPILMMYYGDSYWLADGLVAGRLDFLLSNVFPAVAVIWFWIAKQATPGKMAIHAKIVDAGSGKAPSNGQCIGRYFAYFVSALPVGLGFIWILFDPRSQGWHDKLAGTVVVAPKVVKPREVRFDQR